MPTASTYWHCLQKDIDVIVNACDAGREGELISNTPDIGKVTKPVKRLWMQSMTTGAIQEACKAARRQHKSNLADAANAV